MKTLNSLKPLKAKAELISFVLLVILFTALYFYWRYQTRLAGSAQQEKIISPVMKHADVQAGILPCPAEIPLPKPIEAHIPLPPAKKNPDAHEFISPPLQAYAVKNQSSMVNANTGEIISTRCKSRIEIPVNAFVDSRGNVVEGNVKVDYREYHDFHDIFLSGIPMDFEKGMLESAGMIEINASQNG